MHRPFSQNDVVSLLKLVAPLAHAQALLAERRREAGAVAEAGQVARGLRHAGDAVPRLDVRSAGRVPAVAFVAVAAAERAVGRPAARRAPPDFAAAHRASVEGQGALQAQGAAEEAQANAAREEARH